ncbi:MAG: hypothetical protein ABI889_11905 [Gemmatimonadota bacterium]
MSDEDHHANGSPAHVSAGPTEMVSIKADERWRASRPAAHATVQSKGELVAGLGITSMSRGRG